MIQARRQEFPEGGSSTRFASRAPRGRGFGGLEQSQKPRDIWSKILQSSNFKALHSNFRHKMSTLIVVISFQGGVRSNPSTPKMCTFKWVNCFQGGVRSYPSTPPPPWLWVCDLLYVCFRRVSHCYTRI